MHDDREPIPDAGDLVTIARFRSAAEAGYFADELEADGAARPVLTAVDDFDAMAGHWGSVYLLRVPTADAKRMSQRLRELVAETSDDEESEFERRPAAADGGGSWLPLALAFAAGSAVLFAVQKADRVAAGPPRPAGMPDELLDRLGESSRPWVQVLPDGGRLELRTEPGDVFVLREDRDGDGRPETTTRFRLNPAGF
ncbi:MAG TPA: hypothetical protein VF170_12745 [Planctomycetaceae bacterium]